MCCDICPKYDECEERDWLEANCCTECPEHKYCNVENKEEERDTKFDEDL